MAAAIEHSATILKKYGASDLENMDRLVQKFSSDPSDSQQASGAAARQLGDLLDMKGEGRDWAGLKEIIIASGQKLWLCEQHASQRKLN